MDYLDIAIVAAKKAGAVHLKHFQTSFKVRSKTSSFDLLTAADIESERLVVSTLKENFPEHNFLAEEHDYQKTDSQYTWVIDPLDGTNNFVSGMPIFCVSIALARKGELLLGVVYDATRNELFYAEKGKGAYLNAQPIRVASHAALEQALLITGFYYDRGQHMKEILENIENFFAEKIIGIRRLGAAALDLCYVACGRACGFWEFCLSPWDFAAGKLLVEEAGGKVSGRCGEEVGLEKSYIVASNGKIHRAMLEVLN